MFGFIWYTKKDRSSIRRFDECCENSRLYKQVVKSNCDACYSACFQDGAIELAFLTADIFASFGVLPLLHLRAYTLQDATVYTCSFLYSGNFIISTVKSHYSHCFNCLKLFNEDRQYPKNGRFWP